MSVLTFKHGIHPPDYKSYTKDKAIEVILPKTGSLMVYPLVQHIGAPCKPIVSKGDYVFLGQKIGDSDAFVSSPVHSSVSGTVKDITMRLSPNGTINNAVIIENDGKLTEHESISPKKNYLSYSKDELLKIIKEAGVVGLGGAGFPTHVKLAPPDNTVVDTIIVNGAECEPYLTTDYRVMLEESERIVIGLKIVLSILKGAKGIIAIEDNKPDAIAAITKACENEDNINVYVLKTKYPQGSEKQLIYSCTKREVPSGGLPADAGVIVDNVDTIIAIHRALLRGRPLMRKVITIVGGCVKNPGNYKARLGTSYAELIESIGGLTEEPTKIISGGPMMGVSIHSLDVPVVKTSSGILCLTKEEAYIPPEKNCIRCGKCVEYCAMSLMPLELNKFALDNDFESFAKNNGMDCIECGSCSYVCPSNRHLAQSIRALRRHTLLFNIK